MATCGFNDIFTRGGERARLVVFWLAVVDTRPVFKGRDVKANLHGFCASKIFTVGHDTVEELCAKPVEELAEHLGDDDGVDVVEVEYE